MSYLQSLTHTNITQTHTSSNIDMGKQTKSLANLLESREQIQAEFQRFIEFCNSPAPINVKALEFRLKRAEACWDEFRDVQSAIERLDKTEVNARIEFEEKYYILCDTISQSMPNSGNSIQPSTSSMSFGNQHCCSSMNVLQLPPLQLPTFNGSRGLVSIL